MSNLLFLISWISNAFFVFITLALMVQGILGAFRCKSYRLRVFARMIPGLALLSMPFFHSSNMWNFLNPLSCNGWLQKLVIYFFPGMQSYLAAPKGMLLNNYFHFGSFTTAIHVFLGMFIALTAIVFLAKVVQICSTFVHMRRLVQEAKIYSLRTDRNKLAAQIERHRIRLFVSDAAEVPMAIGSRTIIISQTALRLLSPGELESVVAHELAHLLAKDPWIRVFHQLLRAFFWWIPMKGWLTKIEEDQEVACDQAARKCQGGDEIASALVKIAWFSRNREKLGVALCELTTQPHFLLVRLGMILGTKRFQENRFWKGVIPMTATPLILLSCTM